MVPYYYSDTCSAFFPSSIFSLEDLSSIFSLANYRQSAKCAEHLWVRNVQGICGGFQSDCSSIIQPNDHINLAIVATVDEDSAGGQSCACMDQKRVKQRSTEGIVRVKRSTYAFVYARPEVKVLPSAMLLPCVVLFNAFFTFLEAISKKHGRNQLNQIFGDSLA